MPDRPKKASVRLLRDSRAAGSWPAREGQVRLLASAGVLQGNPPATTSLSVFQGTRPPPALELAAVTPQRRKHAHKACMRWMISDTQTDMLLGEPKSAICVQRFDDSLNSAIHTTYRSWLRSSSMREPRDPPSKVVSGIFFHQSATTAVVPSDSRHVHCEKHWRGWRSGRDDDDHHDHLSLASDRHLTARPTPEWFGTVHRANNGVVLGLYR